MTCGGLSARAEFNGAFVPMQHFGYRRRDPDGGEATDENQDKSRRRASWWPTTTWRLFAPGGAREEESAIQVIEKSIEHELDCESPSFLFWRRVG